MSSNALRTATVFSLPVLALAGSLAITPPTAHAQDEDATPADAGATADADAGRLRGPRPGSNRISLFGGFMLGQTARDVTVSAAPLDFPEELRIELDDAPIFGLRYLRMLPERYGGNHWGVELSVSHGSFELFSHDEFDPEETMQVIMDANLSPPTDQELFDRLQLHAGPFDVDVTFFDVGATYVFTPQSRWVAEAGGGVGWSSSTLPGGRAIYEKLAHSVQVLPGDEVTIANEIVDLTGGLDCPADNDPCLTMDDASGLTWHVHAGLSHAFTDNVHLRARGAVRFIEQVVDPGDSFVAVEATVGISFLFGQ